MKSRRTCSKCKKLKPIIAFAVFRHRDGRPGRRGICRGCRDEYQHRNFEKLQRWRKQYNRRNRTKKRTRDLERRLSAKAYVDAYKIKTPCADCGKKWPPVAMDFDHVRGAKFRSVAGLVSGAYNLELIKIEIAKCELVCACCHRIRTAKRKQNLAPSLRVVPRQATCERRRMQRIA